MAIVVPQRRGRATSTHRGMGVVTGARVPARCPLALAFLLLLLPLPILYLPSPLHLRGSRVPSTVRVKVRFQLRPFRVRARRHYQLRRGRVCIRAVQRHRQRLQLALRHGLRRLCLATLLKSLLTSRRQSARAVLHALGWNTLTTQDTRMGEDIVVEETTKERQVRNLKMQQTTTTTTGTHGVTHPCSVSGVTVRIRRFPYHLNIFLHVFNPIGHPTRILPIKPRTSVELGTGGEVPSLRKKERESMTSRKRLSLLRDSRMSVG